MWGPCLPALSAFRLLLHLQHCPGGLWGASSERYGPYPRLLPYYVLLERRVHGEPLLALSAGSLWAIRVRKDLLVACVLAALAAATRNVGIFLVVPLMYEWIKDIERLLAGDLPTLAPGGLLAYMGYLWVRFGDPLLFYPRRRAGEGATGPLDTASRAWGGRRRSGRAPRPVGPSLSKQCGESTRRGEQLLQPGLLRLRHGRIARRAQIPAPIPDRLRFAARRPRHALRDAGEPADGHPTVRARAHSPFSSCSRSCSGTGCSSADGWS